MALSTEQQIEGFLEIPGDPFERTFLDAEGREVGADAASMIRLRKRTGSGWTSIRVDVEDPRFADYRGPR